MLRAQVLLWLWWFLWSVDLAGRVVWLIYTIAVATLLMFFTWICSCKPLHTLTIQKIKVVLGCHNLVDKVLSCFSQGCSWHGCHIDSTRNRDRKLHSKGHKLCITWPRLMCITAQTNNGWLGGEMLLVVAPVGWNTAYSDMLHCLHGGWDCTILSLGNRHHFCIVTKMIYKYW